MWSMPIGPGNDGSPNTSTRIPSGASTKPWFGLVVPMVYVTLAAFHRARAALNSQALAYTRPIGGTMNQTYSRMFAALLIVFIGTIPAIAATACESLASVALPHTKITSAQLVAAGTFVAPGGRGEGTARGTAAN